MKEFIEKLIGRLEDGIFSMDERMKYDIKTQKHLISQNQGIRYAINSINELAEEYINTSTDTSTDTSSGWIPCSERLPAEDGYYLTTIRFYHLHNLVAMGCNFEDGKWLYMDGDDEVLAWMPLPQPYKEGVTENERNSRV